MYIGENESSEYWIMVLNDLKNRGLKDMLIFSTDNLPGFSQAITAVHPKVEIQKCIIHQIRGSTRYVNHKDREELMNDLKTVFYKVNTEEIALAEMDYFEGKRKKKYPSCVGSWRNNWAELSTFFKHPPEMRKPIYTTNAIENFNRQLRKVTKNKSISPTGFFRKSLYPTMVNAISKWTARMKGLNISPVKYLF